MTDRVEHAHLARLYADYSADVFRVIWGVVSNRAAAEDLTHETFLKAQQNLSRLDAERPVRPWLLTIAVRTALDSERREKRARLFWRREGSTPEIPSSTGTVDSRLDTDAALRQLDPKQRAVVVARYYADMTYDEIGRSLGISPTNVGVILHRAHARLRELMGPRESSSAVHSGQQD